MGHRVTVAGGVGPALDLARGATPIDLLISDIGLPDGSGLDLMRRLRELRPGLPGVALSGYGTEADVQRSLAAGFAQHLTKPISIDQLKALTAARSGV
jgi:CheY-like chemotaxis protein